MSRSACLIVGLGNPGPEYAGTRHNIGFEVVQALADQLDVDFERDRAEALVAWGRWKGRDVGLAMPTTFMNRSGTAVKTLLRLHEVSVERLLVVYDDLNLPLGTIRLRPAGRAGGHNGIQDIIDRLGSAAYARLRVGIGNDFPRGHQVKYVLSAFAPDERPVADEAVEQATQAVLTFARDGITTAMNRHN
ncbi:MAG: aminoacyl-tRNA hydrolase [Bacteroidota bacterium]